MGMTIDNAKEWLKLAVPIKALTEEEFATFIQAVNLAVDTMEKYQKIQELIEYHMLRFLPKERMSGFQKDILEVVDNGKID